MTKLITDKAKLNAAIESIARRGKRFDNDVQTAALSCMHHHANHGDVTLTNRLVEAMPNGSRVNALRAYIETFSAVAWDEEAKAFKHDKTRKHRLDAASETTWVEFKPEAAYKPIDDPMEALSNLIGRFDKDREQLGDKSKVDPAMLDALKTFRAARIEDSIAH